MAALRCVGYARADPSHKEYKVALFQIRWTPRGWRENVAEGGSKKQSCSKPVAATGQEFFTGRPRLSSPLTVISIPAALAMSFRRSEFGA